MSNPSKIQPSDFHQILSGNPNTQFIDVRTPAEFREVHVPEAVLHPLGSLNPASFEKETRFDRDKPLYILCRSGARATTASVDLAAAGFKNVQVVKGGIEEWAKKGLPVVRGAKQAISIERQVRIGAGALVFTFTILGILISPFFLALPAFIGAGLVFAGATDWCGMGLLLAKAPWNK
jgi:rhodanese-related sulfurtransferase